MTREQIESAVEGSVPFAVYMADGKEFGVPHRDYIFLLPKATYWKDRRIAYTSCVMERAFSPE